MEAHAVTINPLGSQRPWILTEIGKGYPQSLGRDVPALLLAPHTPTSLRYRSDQPDRTPSGWTTWTNEEVMMILVQGRKVDTLLLLSELCSRPGRLAGVLSPQRFKSCY
jgi:hypothetical protein